MARLQSGVLASYSALITAMRFETKAVRSLESGAADWLGVWVDTKKVGPLRSLICGI